MTLRPEVFVWWYDELEETVACGLISRIDKHGYAHFHKAAGQPVAAPPRQTRDCHPDREAAIDRGIEFLEIAKLDLDRRIAVLRTQREGTSCLKSTRPTPVTQGVSTNPAP